MKTLDPPRRGDHLSALALERAAFEDAEPTGELEHLRTCPTCQAAVAELRAGRDAFLAARPPEAFLASIEEPPRLRWLPWATRVVPLALAAAGLSFVLLRPSTETAETTEIEPGRHLAHEAVVLKGARLGLTLYVSRGGEPARRFDPSEPLGPRDVLRFAATVPSDGFVFVANLDGEGRFTRYYPAPSKVSAPITEGVESILPGSIELDDFVGVERISLLFSRAPLTEEAVARALGEALKRASGDLARMGPPELDAEEAALLVRKVR